MDPDGASRSIAVVLKLQGVMVLAVVIAYEVVRRFQRRMEQQQVTRELAAQDKRPAETTGAQA